MQKYQEIIASEVNQSRQVMSQLIVQVSKANEMYKVSTDRFESVSNRMEDINFLQTPPRGSAE